MVWKEDHAEAKVLALNLTFHASDFSLSVIRIIYKEYSWNSEWGTGGYSRKGTVFKSMFSKNLMIQWWRSVKISDLQTKQYSLRITAYEPLLGFSSVLSDSSHHDPINHTEVCWMCHYFYD